MRSTFWGTAFSHPTRCASLNRTPFTNDRQSTEGKTPVCVERTTWLLDGLGGLVARATSREQQYCTVLFAHLESWSATFSPSPLPTPHTQRRGTTAAEAGCAAEGGATPHGLTEAQCQVRAKSLAKADRAAAPGPSEARRHATRRDATPLTSSASDQSARRSAERGGKLSPSRVLRRRRRRRAPELSQAGSERRSSAAERARQKDKEPPGSLRARAENHSEKVELLLA